MKVINRDPSNIIPDISEDDINNKIIISYKQHYIEKRDIFNYIIKIKIDNNHDMFRFRGTVKDINDYKWRDNIVVWYDTYNFGNSIMDLIIKEYKFMEENCWFGDYYIIETYDELITMINDVKLNDNFKHELIEHWNSLPGNQRL